MLITFAYAYAQRSTYVSAPKLMRYSRVNSVRCACHRYSRVHFSDKQNFVAVHFVADGVIACSC